MRSPAAPLLALALLAACPAAAPVAAPVAHRPAGGQAGPTAALWHWENPRPQGSAIAALVSGSRTLHAVGAHGAALLSRDGGRSWTVAPTGVTADLTGLAIGARAIHAVGAGGTLLRSTDGGTSYDARPSPIAADLVAIAAAPGGRLYLLAQGGVVLRSDDDGTTFTALPAVPSGDTLGGARAVLLPPGGALAIAAPTADVVLVAGPEGLLRSADAGATFAPVPVIDQPVLGIVADAAGTLFAVGGTDVTYDTVNSCGSCVPARYQTLSIYRSPSSNAATHTPRPTKRSARTPLSITKSPADPLTHASRPATRRASRSSSRHPWRVAQRQSITLTR